MDIKPLVALASTSLLFLSSATVAAVGGASGYDESLVAISPTGEAVDVGLASEMPPPIARYLLARGAGAARLSPDGTEIAVSLDITGESQVWIMPAEGGAPRQLTFGNGITFFRWTPDGNSILYGADNDGDERDAFLLVSRGGNEEREVLPASDQGFRSFGDFASDGRFYYASTERNGLDYDLYVSDLDGNTKRVFEGTYAYRANSVSPDGRYVIVTEAVGEDSDNLYVLDTTTSKLTVISKPERRANHGDAGFAWTRDSDAFYFATNLESEFTHLARYEVTTGRLLRVLPSWSAPESDVGQLRLCQNGKVMVWTENHDGFHRIKARTLAFASEIDVPPFDEGVLSFHCPDDGPDILVRVNGWQTPGDVYRWNLDRRKADRVYRANLAGISPETLVRPESIRMGARDGVTLQGLLYLPPGEPPEDGFPILFDVHGGPSSQSQATFEPVVQYHVQQGVAVFQPNVRGSTGLGKTYSRLDDRERRLDSIRDLVDMLTHFDADPRLDSERAAVMGGSYGGYAVNAVLANFPGHFVAGISKYGVADWVTALEIASPSLKASDRVEYGDIREPRWLEFYTDQSPIRQVDQINVPVLYSHGVNDPRIDIAETEVMVRALRERGIEAPYIRIPDEGHGWRKLENQIFYHRQEAEFLRRYLKQADAP